MVTFEPIDEDLAAAVTGRMREADRREAIASGGLYHTMQPEEVGRRIARASIMGAVVCVEDRAAGARVFTPVAIVAIGRVRPWIGEAAMVATDDWPRVALPATRWVKRFLIPTCRRVGLRRVECRVAEQHTLARRWLSALGAIEETVLAEWGRNGESFVLCSWT